MTNAVTGRRVGAFGHALKEVCARLVGRANQQTDVLALVGQAKGTFAVSRSRLTWYP
jgi:hypothetical protein